jgi:uncharacterized protein (TIGR02266 family)
MSELPNQREHRRIAIETEISISSGSQFYTGFTKNISSGGLFISTHERYELGEQFQVRFRVDQFDKDFDILAEVRWVSPYREDLPDQPVGLGVQFVGLSEGDQAILDMYLKNAETLFYDDDDDL